MPLIPPTTNITIDDQNFDVSVMSAEIQQMIGYLDEWRQQETNEASKLLKTRAALRDLQNTILVQIQKEQKEAADAAETPETPETPETTVPDVVVAEIAE